MGLALLLLLSTSLVVALAPPKAVRPRVRIGAIVALVVFACGAGTARADGPTEERFVANVGWAGLVTAIAMSVPVTVVAVRQRARQA